MLSRIKYLLYFTDVCGKNRTFASVICRTVIISNQRTVWLHTNQMVALQQGRAEQRWVPVCCQSLCLPGDKQRPQAPVLLCPRQCCGGCSCRRGTVSPQPDKVCTTCSWEDLWNRGWKVQWLTQSRASKGCSSCKATIESPHPPITLLPTTGNTELASP